MTKHFEVYRSMTRSDLERTVATRIVRSTGRAERELLIQWAKNLMEIRACSASRTDKLIVAIADTVESEALISLMKLVASEMKRVGWDERGIPARMALGAALLSLTASGQGAGIAALGTAVGVPLWVVFGAGGAFVGVLIDELTAANKPRRAHSDRGRRGTPLLASPVPEVIDAEFVEVKKKSGRRRKTSD